MEAIAVAMLLLAGAGRGADRPQAASTAPAAMLVPRNARLSLTPSKGDLVMVAASVGVVVMLLGLVGVVRLELVAVVAVAGLMAAVGLFVVGGTAHHAQHWHASGSHKAQQQDCGQRRGRRCLAMWCSSKRCRRASPSRCGG